MRPCIATLASLAFSKEPNTQSSPSGTSALAPHDWLVATHAAFYLPVEIDAHGVDSEDRDWVDCRRPIEGCAEFYEGRVVSLCCSIPVRVHENAPVVGVTHFAGLPVIRSVSVLHAGYDAHLLKRNSCGDSIDLPHFICQTVSGGQDSIELQL